VKLRNLAAMLCGIGVTAPAPAPTPVWGQDQPDPHPREARTDSLLRQVLASSGAPGIAAGVVQQGKAVYQKAFGVATVGTERWLTPFSQFHMASVTKPFVATSVMQLVEQGKIKLDEPVTTYLPYFELKDPRFKKITIRQLLTHTSGMRDVTDYQWTDPEFDGRALERYVRSLKDSTLLSVPGARFRYSNIGFEILGDVIAKVSGVEFETYVERHILKPLGMARSTLLYSETDPRWLTSPHVLGPDQRYVVSKVFPYHRAHAASSTLYSSVEDMSRWLLANLNRGELAGKRILAGETYDELWKPQFALPKGSGFPVGANVWLSWFLYQQAGRQVIAHGGGDVGFRSYVALVPDEGLGVVVMMNSDAPMIRDVGNRLLEIFGGKKGP